MIFGCVSIALMLMGVKNNNPALLYSSVGFACVSAYLIKNMYFHGKATITKQKRGK